MNNQTWWYTAKPWVIQCGLMLLIGLLLWFGVRSLHMAISGRMDTIQQMDVLREYRSAEMQRLSELEKQNALIESRAQELDIILSKEELVGFVRELERLAKNEGVEIEIVSRDNTFLESKTTPKESPGKDKKEGVSGESNDTDIPPTPNEKRKTKATGLLDALPLKHYIRITLTIKAPYRAMISYLSKVETMPYALEVLGLSIKEAEAERVTNVTGVFSGDLVQGGEQDVVAIPEAAREDVSAAVVLATELDLVVYTKE